MSITQRQKESKGKTKVFQEFVLGNSENKPRFKIAYKFQVGVIKN